MKKGLVIFAAVLVVGLLIFWFLNRDETVQDQKRFDLSESYELMAVGPDGINGYILDVRIFGRIDNERFDEAIRVRNYMDEQYEITFIDRNVDVPERGRDRRENEENEELEEDYNEYFDRDERFYVIGDKVYQKIVEEDEFGFESYVEYEDELLYTNPAMFFSFLSDMSGKRSLEVEQMGQHTFYKYTTMIEKTKMKSILEQTSLGDYELSDDVTVEILLDADAYVYRVTYKFDDLTILASYFAIDNVFQMNLPIN